MKTAPQFGSARGKVEIAPDFDAEIPDTDLVRISEREVLERAKEWAKALRSFHYGAGEVKTRAHDNLLAAVALLESREATQKERTTL